MKKLLFLLFCVILCLSCKTVQQIEYQTVKEKDTVYIKDFVKDSIFVDNITYINGDTIRLISYKYVYKTEIDTVIEYRDRFVDKYIEKVVEKKVVPKWCWCVMCACGLIIIGFILYVIFKIYRK